MEHLAVEAVASLRGSDGCESHDDSRGRGDRQDRQCQLAIVSFCIDPKRLGTGQLDAADLARKTKRLVQ